RGADFIHGRGIGRVRNHHIGQRTREGPRRHIRRESAPLRIRQSRITGILRNLRLVRGGGDQRMAHQPGHVRIGWLAVLPLRGTGGPGEQVPQRQPELTPPVDHRADTTQQVLPAQTDESRDQLGYQGDEYRERGEDEDEADDRFQDEIIHGGSLGTWATGPTVIAAVQVWAAALRARYAVTAARLPHPE